MISSRKSTASLATRFSKEATATDLDAVKFDGGIAPTFVTISVKERVLTAKESS